MLNPSSEEIDSSHIQYRGPTQREGENRENGPKMYNYQQQYDRPPFIQAVKKPKLNKVGRPIKKNNKFCYEEVNSEETLPNIDWCNENGLDLTSHPADWFDAFLPRKNKRFLRFLSKSNRMWKWKKIEKHFHTTLILAEINIFF